MSIKRVLLFAVSAAVLQAGFPAVGQEAVGLEEIVVTAERREASLQTVPIAVSALSTETLEKLQVTEARNLERYVPSLRMSNNVTSPTNISPSMRGSLQQDASLVVAESPFGIYVDDVYLGRLNGNNVTLADIERVEVLRGPQGTLYGRNTLAGAIKFVSRTPGEESWLKVTAGAGNFDQYLLSASIGGPLNDSWAASFSAQVNNKNLDYTNRLTGAERGLEHNVAYRGKLHYMGSEAFDAVFSVSYSDSKNDAVQLLPGTTPADPMGLRQYRSGEVLLTYGNETVSTPNQPYGQVISNQPRGDTEQLIASANLAYEFDAFTLRSITGYVKTDDYFSTDFGGVGGIVGASDPRAEQFTEELQILGTGLDDRLNYLAGVYFLNEKGKQDFGWFIAGLGPTSTSQIVAETDSISFFGQADYKLSERLKLTAGVRWVQDKKDFSLAFQRRTPVPLGPLTDRVALDRTFEEWTPKVGLDYTVDAAAFDSLLLYASAGRGFKSGGFNGINITNANIARIAYGPESNWTYEVGAKADLLDRRLRVNAAAFLADVSDIAMNSTVVFGGIPAFPVDNQGDATIKGLEVESVFVPTDGLNIFANLALLDGKYDSVKPGSAAADALRLYGVAGAPPQLPDYTFTVGFDYGVDIPLGSKGSRLRFGADWYRTDDYLSAATNDAVIEAYDRFNGFIGLEFGEELEFRIAARNIADEQPVYVAARALGGYLVLPAREVMFTVSYRR